VSGTRREIITDPGPSTVTVAVPGTPKCSRKSLHVADFAIFYRIIALRRERGRFFVISAPDLWKLKLGQYPLRQMLDKRLRVSILYLGE
jgi:hypothetical protein